jgi:hypothetical protein
VAIADPTGARFGAVLFAAGSLYMLWEAVTCAPSIAERPWVGYVGACIFAGFAMRLLWVARNAHAVETRTTRIDIIAGVIEGAGYFLALSIGIGWLMRYLSGRASPPDDAERSGLMVLAFVLALIVVGIASALGRRVRSHDAPKLGDGETTDA